MQRRYYGDYLTDELRRHVNVMEFLAKRHRSADCQDTRLQLAALAGRHHEKYQSQGRFPDLAKQSTNSDHGGVYSSNTWTGAFRNETDGTFAVITSTFTVPAISGPNGSCTSIRIGIDDLTCTSANILAGIDLSVTENETSYKAFSQWWPHDNTISTADVIRTTANVLSATSGAVLVETSPMASSTVIVNLSYIALLESATRFLA
ncbi:hypothetical protein EV363DRAFT_1292066 [Boletus edulis]|nr:hypothetical protein EV363DRAFT_1292066 [Boletus edulis]